MPRSSSPAPPRRRLAAGALGVAVAAALGTGACTPGRGTPGAGNALGGVDASVAPPAGPAALVAYGGGLNVSRSGSAQAGQLVLDGAGVPVVAWVDAADGTPRLRLRTAVGGTWAGVAGSDVGGGLSGAAGAARAALAYDPRGGGACVAFAAPGPGGVLSMRCLTGGAWRDLAGVAPAAGAAAAGLNDVGAAPVSGLALGTGSQLTLLWAGLLATAADGQAGARIWSRVVGADGLLASSQALTSPSLSLSDLAGASAPGSAGWLLVAATVAPPDPTVDGTPSTVQVFRQQGAQLLRLSGTGPTDPAVAASGPALALSVAGLPTVAWLQPAGANSTGTSTVALASYDGQGWTSLPTPRCRLDGCGAAAAAPTLALDASGRPIVAWQDGTPGRAAIALQRLVDGAWADVGSHGSAPDSLGRRGDLTPVGLAVDPATQAPVLAWRQDGDIMVAKVN